MAIALPVFLVLAITELLSGELISRKPFKTVMERHTKKPCLKHSFSRLITTAYMNRTNRREQRGCAGGAPRFPRTRRGSVRPGSLGVRSRRDGKRGYRRTGNPFIKALQAWQSNSALKRRGFPRLQVAYLPDS